MKTKFELVDPTTSYGKRLDERFYQAWDGINIPEDEFTICDNSGVNAYFLIDGIPGVKLNISLCNIGLGLLYETAPPYRSKGYCSVAVSKLCKEVLSKPCVPAIHIRSINYHSYRIAEKNDFKPMSGAFDNYKGELWVRENSKYR